MRWKTIEEDWTAYVPQFLDRWPDLDEDEMVALEGDREAFVEYLVDATGLDPEEAEDELTEFLLGVEPADALSDDEDIDLGEDDEEDE